MSDIINIYSESEVLYNRLISDTRLDSIDEGVVLSAIGNIVRKIKELLKKIIRGILSLFIDLSDKEVDTKEIEEDYIKFKSNVAPKLYNLSGIVDFTNDLSNDRFGFYSILLGDEFLNESSEELTSKILNNIGEAFEENISRPEDLVRFLDNYFLERYSSQVEYKITVKDAERANREIIDIVKVTKVNLSKVESHMDKNFRAISNHIKNNIRSTTNDPYVIKEKQDKFTSLLNRVYSLLNMIIITISAILSDLKTFNNTCMINMNKMAEDKKKEKKSYKTLESFFI